MQRHRIHWTLQYQLILLMQHVKTNTLLFPDTRFLCIGINIVFDSDVTSEVIQCFRVFLNATQ